MLGYDRVSLMRTPHNRLRFLGSACIAVFLASGGRALPQSVESIAVRVINAKTGKPVSNRTVSVSYTNPPHGYSTRVDSKTTLQGTAWFKLNERPSRLMVDPLLRSWTLCSPDEFSTEEILRQGVVADNKCDPTGKVRKAFSARPGELVIFAAYGNLWKHIWGRLPRQ